MSRENVELIKAVTDYYVRGERDAYLACFAEDVEVRPDVNRFPEAEPFRGREEFKRFLAEVDQTWEGGDNVVLREIFAVGDRVVVRADWGGRGRASGVDLRTSLTTISTVQDGQVTRIEYFFDHTKALAAAGRSEAPVAQENVELAYQVYEAINRRDLAALLALLDADVEYVSGLVAIEGGYHGHDGIRRWWENLLDTFPDFTIEVIDIRSLGDLTIATLRNSAHSGGSDKPVEQRQWGVAQWRNNKMIWGGGYPTEAEALEAVGLSG